VLILNIYMFKNLGSNPFLKQGNMKPPQASYNDPTIIIYVIVKWIKNKKFKLKI